MKEYKKLLVKAEVINELCNSLETSMKWNEDSINELIEQDELTDYQRDELENLKEKIKTKEDFITKICKF